MTTLKATAAILLAVLITGCNRTRVHVSFAGRNAPDAEVYVDGNLRGQTDANGILSISPQLPAGAQLIARQRIFERAAYRQDHDGWVQRVYITSMRVNDDGTLSTFRITDPAATQELVLENTNVLNGLHVLVSLDWDASEAELEDMRQKWIDAARYIWNLTDGQILFEQVEIADNARFWPSAEYHYWADNTIWPHTVWLGGYLGREWFGQPTIEMSRRTDSNASHPRMFVHEFGHLGFSIQDEYAGLNIGGNFCTANMLTTGNPFSPGMPQASCFMDNHMAAQKICSGHLDNPHRNMNFQIWSPCWNSVLSNYGDTQNPPRWLLKSPDTRGAIVGQLPPLPPQWEPRINVFNGGSPVCAPIPVKVFFQDLTTPAPGYAVLLLPATGGAISMGKSDANGNITVVGAHIGDSIKTPTQVLPVTGANCTPVP
jgi:hypothetical protein